MLVSKTSKRVTNIKQVMESMNLILFGATILCNGGIQGWKTEIFENLQTPDDNEGPMQPWIRVRIKKDDKMESFFMNVDATAAALHRHVESLEIVNPLNSTILWENDSLLHFIPDEPSISLLDILPPPSLANLVMPHQLNLSVIDMNQIDITIQITNGNQNKSFEANAGTRTNEVYQKAVDIGILDNFYQFILRYQSQPDRTLINDASPSTAPIKLLNVIDLKSPNELKLVVSPVPEGVLLFWMFREMSPNQQVPSWDYAQFCNQNPWHELCSSLSGRVGYESNMTVSATAEEVEDAVSNIRVVNVPTWSGRIHLEHIPRTVRKMTLKGQSIRVNFDSLRYTAQTLKELTLDFVEGIGLDVVSLSGSSLEILRLPSHPGLRAADVHGVLEMLTTMRAKNKIHLKMVVFGRKNGQQQIIWYAPEARKYEYLRIEVHAEFEKFDFVNNRNTRNED